MQLNKLIENHWYKEGKLSARILLNILLFLPSTFFLIIVALRSWLYRFNILKSYKLPIPVVIVGNITVGGSGKTPLVKELATELLNRNIKTGIILRGYKSSSTEATIVTADSSPEMAGDEALIYASNKIPVAIGRNRYQAGLKLLEHYPDLQIILSDDGMQHYRLQRDYEIAVIDKTRILGNRFLLPNGPLREPVCRLKNTNAIVVNTETKIEDVWFSNNLRIDHNTDKQPLRLTSKLVLEKIYNPITKESLTISDFINESVIAIAAIGNPQRFFKFIEDLGICLTQTISYPDHYYYTIDDIPKDKSIILTTEKDYVKLAQFNPPNIYIVKVKASLSNNELTNTLINMLTSYH